MTLRQFIERASMIKDELQDKEIFIEAKNGLLFEPAIKFIMKDTYPIVMDKEHVEKIIIEDINVDFDMTRVTSEGHPLGAVASIVFSSYEIVTKDKIDELFSRKEVVNEYERDELRSRMLDQEAKNYDKNR